jgi:hypothetical protein
MDYINGINGVSETQPNFYVGAMRRNKIKNINVCETLTVCRFDIFNKIFEHQIIFVDNEYCYCIAISIVGQAFELKMPDCFEENNETL